MTALYSGGGTTQSGGNQFIVEGRLGTLDGIQGALAVHGGGGCGVAGANDAANTQGHTYTLTTGQLQRDGMATITYDGVSIFGVFTANNPHFGHTPNTVYVQSLGPVYAGLQVGAGDTVTVGHNGSLASILADLRIQSYLGVPKQVTLDDSADTTARTVTLSSDPTLGYLVTGLANASQGRGRIGLILDPTTPVLFRAGSGGNTFAIQAALAPTTIDAGTGGDTFNVGSAANTLDPIQAAVTINGQGSKTTLTFNDQGGTPGAAPKQVYNYSLAQNSFSRTGTATVTWSGIAAVSLYAANGGVGYNVLGVASTAPARLITSTPAPA